MSKEFFAEKQPRMCSRRCGDGMILETNFFGILKSSAVSRDGYTLISVYFNKFELNI